MASDDDHDGSFAGTERPRHEYVSSRLVGWSNCSTPVRGDADSPTNVGFYNSPELDFSGKSSKSPSYEDPQEFFPKSEGSALPNSETDFDRLISLNSSASSRLTQFTSVKVATGNSDLSSLKSPDHVFVAMEEPWGKWLGPAILKANGGLVITAALMMGIAAVESTVSFVVVGGLGGVMAGACSIAIAEYVSASSHRDNIRRSHHQRKQDVQDWNQSKDPRIKMGIGRGGQRKEEVHDRPQSFSNHHGSLKDISESSCPEDQRKDCVGKELNDIEKFRVQRLTEVYMNKGLSYTLANQVSQELLLCENNFLDGSADDGIKKPWEVAVKSAAAFSAGAFIPLVPAFFVTNYVWKLGVLGGTSMLAFASFGACEAFLRSGPILRSSIQMTVGGCSALGIAFGFMKVLTAKLSII